MTAWRPSSQQTFCESPRAARGRLRGCGGGGAKRCLAGQSGDGQSEGAVLHANRTLNGRRRDNRQTTRKTIVYKSNPMIWLQIGQIGTSAFRQDTLSEIKISLGNHMKRAIPRKRGVQWDKRVSKIHECSTCMFQYVGQWKCNVHFHQGRVFALRYPG